MSLDEQAKVYKEYQDKFNGMSNEALIDAFNRQAKNPGVVARRMIYEIALNNELKKRKITINKI